MAEFPVIQVQNTIGSCDGFVSPTPNISAYGGEAKTRTFVISPLKITLSSGFDKQVRIVNGCNMGENCMNPDCWFGVIIRNKKRAESRVRKEQRDE